MKYLVAVWIAAATFANGADGRAVAIFDANAQHSSDTKAPPSIHFPDPPGPLPPSPPPPNPPGPAPGVPKLNRGVYYFVTGEADFFVTTSPPGMVAVKACKSPLNALGTFIDGTGQVEERSITAKVIYRVEPAAVGRCEVLAIPLGAKAEADIVRRTIDVDNGQGPQPPPNPPEPPTPPTPPPSPPPIPGDGLRVLIVYETAEISKYPPMQAAVITSKSVRDYLNSHCAKGPTGSPEWRQFDPNVPFSTDAQLWRDAMARPRKSLPWIVIANGKAGVECPLPANVADTLALLKKFGGE